MNNTSAQRRKPDGKIDTNTNIDKEIDSNQATQFDGDNEHYHKTVIWVIIKFVYVIGSVIALTPLIIVITVVSQLYKQIVRLVMRYQFGNAVTFMTSADAFCSIEKPQSRCIIVCAFTGTEKLTMEWLRDEVFLKKFFPSNGDAEKDVQKLLRVPLYKYGYRFWMNTGDVFDHKYHIRKFDDLPEDIDDVTDDMLMDYVSSVSNKEFPPNKPPWEILCIPNYLKKTKDSNGKEITKKVWVFITRIHHGYGDGIHLFKNFFFRYADEPFLPQFQNPLKLNFLQSVLMIFGVIACIPYVMKLLFFPQKNPLRGPKTSGEKIVGTSAYIDLTLIRSIKQKYKVSFTSVLLSAFGESLNHYLVSTGQEVPKTIETGFTIPMKVPKATDMNLNNFITGCMVDVSTEKMSLVRRLKILSKKLTAEFRSPLPYATYWTIIAFNNFPEYLTGALAMQAPGTVLCSSVPGPHKAPQLTGEPIDEIMFWIPNKGDLGVSASFLSMCGQLRMGLHVDKALIPTREGVTAILNGWEECIYSLAAGLPTAQISLDIANFHSSVQKKVVVNPDKQILE